ncbi:hypothetical protein [Methylobacterium oryzisoli]|uniref:hypothetical protein n=1 Tax=Methylobacterium oryzisoli TaxID=3385502 RepID=UPI0038916693
MATQAEWDAKVEEIVAMIAGDLFGEGPHSEDQLAEAREEAEDAIDTWEEATVDQIAPLVVNTPLKRLLAEQHDIAEQIPD